MKIKVSDYIVQFLIEKGVTDTFGYPGGSVTNLVDSLHKREEINTHVVYHEQAASFAAAAYAQVSGKIGVAYATGGPGATNLITGIGHAYYDSFPILCLTGNVNTYESKGNRPIRQKAFQESDIISVVKSLTKYCAYVESAEMISYYLEKAYYEAMTGRKGPVLLDLPMNVLREEVELSEMKHFINDKVIEYDEAEKYKKEVETLLKGANRPCFILGNAIKTEHVSDMALSVIEKHKIPYVTSMISFDVLGDHRLNYGFLGAYGSRTANFIASKCDVILAIGTRLDIRQIGVHRDKFAPKAKIVRIDIDDNELEYKVHKDESSYLLHVKDALEVLNQIELEKDFSDWLDVCDYIRDKLRGIDEFLPNSFMKHISRIVPNNALISTDVGQNQVWVAQSFEMKQRQQFLFCGGMGAMGYALPASIGAYYGKEKKDISVCICGDGGFQMNIQELQFIVREQIPIKIFVINNESLGMIRHFQEMYFDGKYYDTKAEGGYTVPSFCNIAHAYGIRSYVINELNEIEQYEQVMQDADPALFEIIIKEDTYVYPKLEFGKENQDQQPLIDRELYNELNLL